MTEDEMSDGREGYRLGPDEGDAWWFLFHRMTVKVGGDQTGGAMTVIEWTAPKGSAPPRHRHEREDELFWVLDGHVLAGCGETQWEVPAGSMVFLPHGIEHGFVTLSESRVVQVTTPAGFEDFVADAGRRPEGRGLPPQEPVDPEWMTEIARRHSIVISGPPLAMPVGQR
jgi:quercetin dioxygenase-like cupin family protein